MERVSILGVTVHAKVARVHRTPMHFLAAWFFEDLLTPSAGSEVGNSPKDAATDHHGTTTSTILRDYHVITLLCHYIISLLHYYINKTSEDDVHSP